MVAVMLAEMSLDDLASMGSGASLPLAAQRKVALVVNAFEKLFLC